MGGLSELQPMLVVLAVGIPLGIGAVLGLARIESARVERRRERTAVPKRRRRFPGLHRRT